MSTQTLTRGEAAPAPRAADIEPARWRAMRHSLVLAQRTLVKMRRTPEQFFDVTVQPIIFLALFVYLFGGAVSGSTHDYLQFVLPGLVAQTGIFSTIAIGANLNTDIKKGLFDRFRSLPIGRSAPLVGAVLGDVIRYLISFVVLFLTALVMGFRIGTGPLQVVAAAALSVVFCQAVSWFGVLLGVTLREAGSVQGIAFLVMFPLTFGSSMFAPVQTMPGWLQAWVHVNPVTHFVEALRGLLVGGPLASPLAWTLGWAVALMAVLAPLAVRAYRKRT